MKKDFLKGDVIDHALATLKRVYPWSKDVQINLEKNSKGEYRSHVQLKYQNKKLEAHKLGPTPQASLSKAFKALFHRLSKLKDERRRWVLKTQF